MTFFILIFILLLAIAVYLNFSFLTYCFSANKTGKKIILISLIISSFGFIISQGLVRSFDNFGLRFLYLFFALSVGLLFYLTIFSILFKIVHLVLPKISPNLLTRIGVALSLALFLVGVFDAHFTQVKNISVNLAGLPKNWQGKKIVQITDTHLGSIYGINFLKKQIVKINNLEPDLIVITGDLFDGPTNRLPEFVAELANLKAKEGVVFVSGNHDVYLGLDRLDTLLTQINFRVLKDEMINIDGLEIIGLDYNKFSGDDTSRNIKNLSSGSSTARLLLNHTPNDISLAKSLKVNLQLSGHSHGGQMFPMSFATKLVYGKYQYGLYTEGDYNIYTSSGLGSWGPPVRTFNPAEIVSIIIN